MAYLSMLFVGLLLGMKHATEADHLAAVATLATRQGSLPQALRQGVAWGVGHTVVLLAVGAIVIMLGSTVPPRLGQALEFCVGIMLVALGSDVLRRLPRTPEHFSASSGPGASRLPLRAFFVGMVHGMAGSAALVILSLATAPSIGSGLLYICVFGVGSIAGMAVLSTAIAVPLRLSARSLSRLSIGLNAGIGTFTCVLGLVIMYRIGVVDGLLTAAA